MYSILFIGVLIVLGGLIAYVGDNFGRKIGKRKVSIFGLRPRYTSILITIITGVLITSFTLSTFIVFSKTARIAFFGLTKTLNELSEKRSQLKILKSRINESERMMRKILEENKKRLRQKQEELDLIVGDVNLKIAEFNRLKKEVEKVKEEREKIFSEKVEIENLLVLSQKNLQEANRDIAELISKKSNLEKIIEASKEEIDNLSSLKNTLEDEVKELTKKVKEDASTLLQTRSKILNEKVIFFIDQLIAYLPLRNNVPPAEAIALFNSFISLLNKEAGEKGAKYGDNKRVIIILRENELYELARNLPKEDNSRGIVVRFFSATNVIVGEPLVIKWDVVIDKLVYRKEEVIVWKVVESNLSRDKIQNILDDLLIFVGEKARKDGILPDVNTGNVGYFLLGKLVDLVDRIRYLGGCIVEVVSAEDTYSSDKLNIKFNVTKSDSLEDRKRRRYE